MASSIVYNHCCIQGMKEYPDNYFDLAIVDPPYGIGIANRIGCIGQKKGQVKITNYPSSKIWDAEIPNKAYWLELFRISKNQIVFGGNYFTDFLPASRGWIVWIKPQPEGVSFAMSELVWTSFDRSIQNIRIDKTFTQNNTSNNKFLAQATCKIHPTQKPVKLYEWILKNYGHTSNKILDTHLGSGSSRIAAYALGYDFTGFELDKDYYEAQEKRFEAFKSDLDARDSMFAPIVQPKQESLFDDLKKSA